VSVRGFGRCWQAVFPLSVAASTERPRGGLRSEDIKKGDRMFATVASQVAVVAVDHRQARAHEPRQLEDRNTGAESEGRVGVAQVIGS
jgi:hypothetical protein